MRVNQQANKAVNGRQLPGNHSRVMERFDMPNHWNLVWWPEHDHALSRFIGWLTRTHIQRWHAQHHSIGSGHLYQGRFQSFVAQADEHLLTLGRSVERNAARAKLVARAGDWRWGSLHPRQGAALEQRPQRAAGPVPLLPDGTGWVNTPQTAAEQAAVRRCLRRGEPFGSEDWVRHAVHCFGLASTRRRPGRPVRAAQPGQLLLFPDNGSDTLAPSRSAGESCGVAAVGGAGTWFPTFHGLETGGAVATAWQRLPYALKITSHSKSHAGRVFGM